MRRALIATVLAAFMQITGGLDDLGAQQTETATGLAISIRAPGGSLQDLFASAAGAPQFSIGYRGERIGLGIAGGLTVLQTSDEDTFTGGVSRDEVNITVFQIGPSLLVDFWRSPDGRTRGNVSATASIGRLSISETDEFTATGGTPQINESSVSGTLIGLRAGIGGDHFLHPHFALGFETGFQGLFALGIEQEGDPQSLSLGASGTYAAVRLTVVF